jgi:hypothetical protein
MIDLFRAVKFVLAVLSAAVMLAGAPSLSHAETGSIRITITRVGFLVGGGSGTLYVQGKRYLLRVGGVSVGPFGAARANLVGRAFHMRTAGSIHGVYSTVLADAPVAGAATTVRLRNWHGVVLELRRRQGGVPSVDLSGMEISLR